MSRRVDRDEGRTVDLLQRAEDTSGDWAKAAVCGPRLCFEEAHRKRCVWPMVVD